MIRSLGRAIALAVVLATAGLALAAPAQANDKAPANRAVQILEANCPRGPATYDIGYGDTGTAVREVQCLLNWTLSAGAYPYIQVDGVYGSITTGAVRVFQTCANNLGAGLTVDGRVGRQTLPHLRWWGQHAYETGDFIC